MKHRSGLTMDVIAMIGLIVFCIVAINRPHHHHDGKFCAEQNEDVSPHPSEEECQLETLHIIVNSDSDSDAGPLQTLTSYPGGFSITPCRLLSYFTIIYPAPQKENYRRLYLPFSHKLRGSPRFS